MELVRSFCLGCVLFLQIRLKVPHAVLHWRVKTANITEQTKRKVYEKTCVPRRNARTLTS